jgi:hypothetical protein
MFLIRENQWLRFLTAGLAEAKFFNCTSQTVGADSNHPG